MLEKINYPDDIKSLNSNEIFNLCSDVRKKIIQVCSKNGGHIAPSLGTVELTVALLCVFSPPHDKIVWDVGHQAYGYKILTKRKKTISSLRKFKGLSGFPNIFESKYDAFGTGHASTSISATLGLRIAKDILKKGGETVAIIGDGAMTGGLSFEGLNHTGDLQKRVIVILNDNQMSISKNIGALQKSLTNIALSKSYNFVKNEVWSLSSNLPKRFREIFISSSRKLKNSVQNIVVPSIFFNELGFRYIGPIDGHNTDRLIDVMTKVKNTLSEPTLIHVITQKGRGFSMAEDNPSRFHGISKFNMVTGETTKSNGYSYSEVFGKKMCKIAEKSNRVIVITAAMKDGVGLSEFANRFPKRFFDVGIAEAHAVTFASGAAKEGLKPFVAIYSTFFQRALDQLIHDCALQKLPVVFCIDRAGLVGEDGATHHGIFDISYFGMIPNMSFFAVSCKGELEEILEFAVKHNKGPIAIRYPRGLSKIRKFSPIEFGKGEIVKNGSDVAIATIGTALEMGLKLRKKLTNIGINSYLVNQRFLKPFDFELWEKIQKNIKIVITLEKNVLSGGFGHKIKDIFCNSKVEVYNYGIGDNFVGHGQVDKLYESIGFSVESIFKEIEKKLEKM